MSTAPATTSDTSVPKYQAIRDDLRNQIRAGNYEPGARLPTERELSESYGVTRMTVRQAIAGLVRTGLVVNRRPQGNFVHEKLPVSGHERHANLICIGTESSHAEVFIEHGIAAAEKYAIEPRVLRIYPGSEHLAAEVINGPDPSLVIGGIAHGQHELLDAVLDASDRVVLIGARLDHRGVRCIVGDDELGLRLAVDHLHARGHRRIGVVGSIIESNHPTMELQIQHWRQAMLTLGLASGTMDKHIVRLKKVTAGGVLMSACESIKDYYERQRVRATAFIALSEEAALGTAAALYQLGVAIPDEASLIAYAGTIRTSLSVPPLTSIDVDVDQHLSTAMRMIDQIIQSEDVSPDRSRIRVIPPVLVERESVGPSR